MNYSQEPKHLVHATGMKTPELHENTLVFRGESKVTCGKWPHASSSSILRKLKSYYEITLISICIQEDEHGHVISQV